MTDLSDSARVVLAAAAQRDDLSVLPFPDDCRAKGGAEGRVLSSLKRRDSGDRKRRRARAGDHHQ
jgi:hypothetical protein